MYCTVTSFAPSGECVSADGGFRIFDISDKTKPKLITHERTFGFGVHRFDVGDNGLIYLLDRNAGFDILEMTI